MSAAQKFPWIWDWRGLPGRAPGAAEVLSLVFCWRPPVCAGGVLAEKWKPSLAEALRLGLGMGLGAGLGWEPLDVVKQRKTPRQRDRGAGLTAKP